MEHFRDMQFSLLYTLYQARNNIADVLETIGRQI